MIKKISSVVFMAIFLVAAINGQSANVEKENLPAEKSPLSYGIVVDNSGSYRMIFETIIKSVNQIVEANEASDETFIVRFTDASKISLIQELTSSKDDLQSAADSMFVEGGLTAILDSVDFSAKYLAKEAANDRRKVLILITDGEDRKSQAKIEAVTKFLKEEKIQVFTLGVADGKGYKNLLEKLAKETGGKSFIVEKRSEIEAVIKQLTAAVRAR